MKSEHSLTVQKCKQQKLSSASLQLPPAFLAGLEDLQVTDASALW